MIKPVQGKITHKLQRVKSIQHKPNPMVFAKAREVLSFCNPAASNEYFPTYKQESLTVTGVSAFKEAVCLTGMN